MASASDVKDVLSLPAKDAEAAAAAQRTKQQAKRSRVNAIGGGSSNNQPRLDGLARELYSLLGDNAPPLVVLQNRVKEKPRLRQKAKQWVWQEFTNGARSDSLRLGHWRLKSEADAEDEPYRFEKFNVRPHVFSYTDQEYEDHLNDDEGWSREETDYLFDMCREYDLRFIIVADRYEFPSATTRTTEDLKDRYYTVCRKLMLSRNSQGMTQTQEELFNQMMFDKEREVQRKALLDKLAQRTPDEIREEEALILEAKRIEASEARLQQERQDIQRLLEEPGSQSLDSGKSSASDPATLTSSANLAALALGMQQVDKARKRRETATQQALVEQQQVQAEMNKRLRKLSPREERMYGVSWHEKLPSVAYMRSQKIPPVKSSLANKVVAAMTELGLPARLFMPTERNCRKLDELQTSIAQMLQAKALVDKLEADKQMNDGRRSATPSAAEASPSVLSMRASVDVASPGSGPGASSQDEALTDKRKASDGLREGSEKKARR